MDPLALYQKNYAVLRKTHPTIAAQLNPRPQPNFFDPAALQTDSLQYRELSGAVMRSVNEGMDFLYLLALGDGQVLCYCAPEITTKNRGILVIEPSVRCFAQALGVNHFGKQFRSRRVFWAVGGHLKEQILAVWDESYSFLADKPVIHSGTMPTDTHEYDETLTMQALVSWIQEGVQERKRDYQNRLKQLPSNIARRKARRSRGRVWGFLDLRARARYSLIQHVLLRSIFYYLQKQGFETCYTALYSSAYYPPYYRLYRMMEFEPDLIFLCNESPAFESALGAEFSRSLPIPKVTWYADDPIHGEHLFQRHGVSKDESFLVADYEWRDPIVENGGAPPIPYLPGAATKTRRGKKRGSRRCEIVFVGQVRDQCHFFANLPRAWKVYSSQVIAEKLRFPRMKIREAMRKFPLPAEVPQDRLDEFRQKVLWEANTRFRVQLIRQLAKYDLHVYGNSDWLAFLPEAEKRRCYQGVLRFKHLFEVYRNAQIVLNIHSLQSYTCLNVRDFDVPAAGGFLISDWLPHADEIFIPGFAHDLPLADDKTCEMFFYRSVPELERLVHYFLTHDEQRQAVLERARLKVLAQHTYKHRVEWLAQYFDARIAAFKTGEDH